MAHELTSDSARQQLDRKRRWAGQFGGHQDSGVGFSKSSTDANNSTSSPPTLSGAEDLQVNFLADPTSVGQAPATTVGASPPPPVQARRQPQVAGSGRRVKKVSSKGKASGQSKQLKEASGAKYRAASEFARHKASKRGHGQVAKRRKKGASNFRAADKYFAGGQRGKKLSGGHGTRGARKGSKYHKDKGYKKRGFKRSYHKLETGDQKSYFDEFRDKDSDNKWKRFENKHKFSQSKRWLGKERKRARKHRLAEKRAKEAKLGRWSERSRGEQVKKRKHQQRVEANKFAQSVAKESGE